MINCRLNNEQGELLMLGFLWRRGSEMRTWKPRRCGCRRSHAHGKKKNDDDDFRCNAMPAGGGGVPIATLLEKRSVGEGK